MKVQVTVQVFLPAGAVDPLTGNPIHQIDIRRELILPDGTETSLGTIAELAKVQPTQVINDMKAAVGPIRVDAFTPIDRAVDNQ